MKINVKQEWKSDRETDTQRSHLVLHEEKIHE